MKPRIAIRLEEVLAALGSLRCWCLGVFLLLPTLALACPQDANVNDCIARAGRAIAVGNLGQAQDIYDELMLQLPQLESGQQLFTLLGSARLARWRGNFALARSHYAQALALEANNAEALTGLGLIALEEKDYRASRDLLQQAATADARYPELQLAQQWLNKAWRYRIRTEQQHIRIDGEETIWNSVRLTFTPSRQLGVDIGLRVRDKNKSITPLGEIVPLLGRFADLSAQYDLNAANGIAGTLEYALGDGASISSGDTKGATLAWGHRAKNWSSELGTQYIDSRTLFGRGVFVSGFVPFDAARLRWLGGINMRYSETSVGRRLASGRLSLRNVYGDSYWEVRAGHGRLSRDGEAVSHGIEYGFGGQLALSNQTHLALDFQESEANREQTLQLRLDYMWK